MPPKRGMAAALAKKREKEKMAQTGQRIATEDFNHLTKQMEEFKEKLEKFSQTHQEKIKKDPLFRKQFTAMCASLGVDPLASSKNLFASVSGVGDFYYELAVQAIEICIACRSENGGLVELGVLYGKLVKTRGKYKDEISVDDLMQALKNLKILGSGFKVVKIGKKYLVQSIPSDMGEDPEKVLNFAEEQGGVCTVDSLRASEGWSITRSETVLTQLLHSSQAWLDVAPNGDRSYWFPALISRN